MNLVDIDGIIKTPLHHKEWLRDFLNWLHSRDEYADILNSGEVDMDGNSIKLV
jgi:ribosomal protein S4E